MSKNEEKKQSKAEVSEVTEDQRNLERIKAVLGNDKEQELETIEALIEELPPELQEKAVQYVSLHRRYSGPLPPPYMVKEYEEILPGAAERIFSSFERQSQHRQNAENNREEHEFRLGKRAQNMAFIITMSMILGGLYLAYTGKDLTGFGMIFTGLASLVAVLFINKKK